MKEEDRDKIVEIFSDTFDKYATEQRKNVHLLARIADLETELIAYREKEATLHEMRVEQGGL